MLKWDILLAHRIGHVDGTTETKYIDEGNYTFPLSFTLWRGNDNTDAVWTDFLAGTQRNVVFKIYNTSTNYSQLTWTNVTLVNVNPTYTINANNQRLWQVNALAEDIAISSKDGVNIQFYGETP